MTTAIDRPTEGDKPKEILTPDSLGGLKVYQAGDIEGPERMLLYSNPGLGKTPIVATADQVNEFHPLLVIDCDEGPKSLRRRYPKVRVISPRSLEQLQRVVDSLVARKGRPFRSICVDGSSTLQYRGYEHVLGKNKQYRSFTQYDAPSWKNGAWQATAQQMTILVETLKSLTEVHLFFTAWAKDVSKPTTQVPEPLPCWEPLFTPAAAAAINGRFDSILFLNREDQNGNTVKYIRSRGNNKVMARDRDDRLPETISEPSMQLLAKHWGLDHTLVEGY